MPGSPVSTTLPQARKPGNAPTAFAWHPTAKSGAGNPPPLPHGLAPWPGAVNQPSIRNHPVKVI